MVAGRRGLLDTNVLIHLSRVGSSLNMLDDTYVSALSMGELYIGISSSVNDPREISDRLWMIQQIETELAGKILPYDGDAARAHGSVAADIIKAGRKVRPRFVDSQIAAVAISNGLTLYTENARDFAGIHGLDVVHVRYDA